jgi:hypothetical protein
VLAVEFDPALADLARAISPIGPMSP